MSTDYKVKGEWRVTESGKKYVAKAVTNSGRILAISSIEVPIDEGTDFTKYYGSKKLKDDVEEVAKEQVRTLADASP